MSKRDEVTDLDNPEWTAEKFARSIKFKDLPASLRKTLSTAKRGPQKAPTKMLVSMRLSRDVVEGLRATGAGWQVRADDALRSWVKRQAKNGKPAVAASGKRAA